jgi:hypothetical protein
MLLSEKIDNWIKEKLNLELMTILYSIEKDIFLMD